MRELAGRIAGSFKSAVIRQSGNELYATVEPSALRDACLFAVDRLGASLISAACFEEGRSFHVDYIFSMREEGIFLVIGANIGSGKFESITPRVPAANWYEREMHEMFGVVPEGHPDLRRLSLHHDFPEGVYPMRRSFDASTKPRRVNGSYEFRRVEGEGIYEIPVGPIHAGIIGPGHFRFSVAGEPILSLEIRLGYTFKGIEKRFETLGLEKGVFLAERISGDNSFAHSLAFCQAVERAAGIEVPQRAAYIRTVFSELERIYYHLGDIAGIATDVGFSVGAAEANRIKEIAMRLNEEACGSRVLRGVNCIGGVRVDITSGVKERLLEMASHLRFESEKLKDMLLSSSSVMDRLERTGTMKEVFARRMNVVGPAARASNVNRDVRRDHPYAAYGQLKFKVPVYVGGDVLSRTKVKMDEIDESCSLIRRAAWSMPAGKLSVKLPHVVQEGTRAVGCVESPRGETVHYVIIGKKGSLYRCKIRDPSFCNWIAMEHAVPGNIVPDFPLVNKSFNLSYSGNDM